MQSAYPLDDTAFEALFKDSFEVLNNVAYTIVKDGDVSKDIVQQVFYKLWKSRETLNISSSVRSYLHRAVINTALNHIEKTRRMVLSEEQQLVTAGPSTVADALENLKHDELESALHKAIDELPDRCRLVFMLSRFDGLTNKEIAERMETTTKTVENQMGKALKHLRESLRPYHDQKLHTISGLAIYLTFGVGAIDHLTVIKEIM